MTTDKTPADATPPRGADVQIPAMSGGQFNGELLQLDGTGAVLSTGAKSRIFIPMHNIASVHFEAVAS